MGTEFAMATTHLTAPHYEVAHQEHSNDSETHRKLGLESLLLAHHDLSGVGDNTLRTTRQFNSSYCSHGDSQAPPCQKR
jgi:hypothetical protein